MASSGFPFLNIGITSVILNKSGYSPSTIHLLYSVHRNCAITDLPYLMNLVGASTVHFYKLRLFSTDQLTFQLLVELLEKKRRFC